LSPGFLLGIGAFYIRAQGIKLKLRVLIFLILFPTCAAFAKAEHSCLSRHIREAMTLNETRKPEYSKLSAGASESISNALISFEKELIVGSYVADVVAYPFQAAGIPIACDEFISMSETPALSSSFATGAPNLDSFPTSRYQKNEIRIRTSSSQRRLF
jgi:hypothetical protein